MNEEIQILDCTLRDGGYKTKWNFSDNFVRNYIKVCNKLDLNYLEVGFRSKNTEGYGPFRNIPTKTVKQIAYDTPALLAVMVDLREMTEAHEVDELVDGLGGIVNLIRITTPYDKLALAQAVVDRLEGFETSINIMRLNEYAKDQNLVGNIISLRSEYVYMVDTCGSCDMMTISEAFNNVSKFKSPTLGFHGHDNLSLAYVNSLSAVSSGAKIVDGTIFGLGHGAGNCRTELLLTAFRPKVDYMEIEDLEYVFLNEDLGEYVKPVVNILTGLSGLRQRD